MASNEEILAGLAEIVNEETGLAPEAVELDVAGVDAGHLVDDVGEVGADLFGAGHVGFSPLGVSLDGVVRIVGATGLSLAYASLIRQGRRVPHFRWWEVLEQLTYTGAPSSV